LFGCVFLGRVKVGDDVEIVGFGERTKTAITGVEMFKKNLGEGQAGDNIGALIRGVKRTDVKRGQLLAKPGYCKTFTKVCCCLFVVLFI